MSNFDPRWGLPPTFRWDDADCCRCIELKVNVLLSAAQLAHELERVFTEAATGHIALSELPEIVTSACGQLVDVAEQAAFNAKFPGPLAVTRHIG